MLRHLIVLSAALAVVVPATAQSSGYSVKETALGSLVPQPVLTGRVPFDRSWAQLTPEQRGVIAADYESLPAGDEPPYPAHGLRHFATYLARFADLREPVGLLVASVNVGPDGRPRGVTVFRTPDPQLVPVVAAMLGSEEYKPAVCQGSPCAMDYLLRVDFPERRDGPLTRTTRLDRIGTKGPIWP